jgi:hypothetical protein
MIAKRISGLVIAMVAASALMQTAVANEPKTLRADQQKKHGLLLPAVQAARPAVRSPRKTSQLRSRPGNISVGKPNNAADTSCSGVSSCNDMIATCISLGGNVTPTSYDPKSGAPDGATCFSPRN